MKKVSLFFINVFLKRLKDYWKMWHHMVSNSCNLQLVTVNHPTSQCRTSKVPQKSSYFASFDCYVNAPRDYKTIRNLKQGEKILSGDTYPLTTLHSKSCWPLFFRPCKFYFPLHYIRLPQPITFRSYFLFLFSNIKRTQLVSIWKQFCTAT